MLRGLRYGRTGFARALAAFALLAIAVRAFLPAGFMLAPAQDGRFVSVVLCSGHTQTQMVMDLETGAILDADAVPAGKSSDHRSQTDAPCAFAMAAHLAPPETARALDVALAAHALEAERPFAVLPGRGLAAPPPWSTGPPSLA